MNKNLFYSIVIVCGLLSSVTTYTMDIDNAIHKVAGQLDPLTVYSAALIDEWPLAIQNSDVEVINYLLQNHMDCRAIAYAYKYHRHDIVRAMLPYINDWDMAYGYICAQEDNETLELALDRSAPARKSIKNFVYQYIVKSGNKALLEKLKEHPQFVNFFRVNEDYIARKQRSKHAEKLYKAGIGFKPTLQERKEFWKNLKI